MSCSKSRRDYSVFSFHHCLIEILGYITWVFVSSIFSSMIVFQHGVMLQQGLDKEFVFEWHPTRAMLLLWLLCQLPRYTFCLIYANVGRKIHELLPQIVTRVHTNVIIEWELRINHVTSPFCQIIRQDTTIDFHARNKNRKRLTIDRKRKFLAFLYLSVFFCIKFPFFFIFVRFTLQREKITTKERSVWVGIFTTLKITI